MGPRTLWLLLLGIFAVFFMDDGDRVQPLKIVRICNLCNFYDGYKCRGGMRHCWKFNAFFNKTCTTEHHYFNDRKTGRYLFRYTKLSCKACEEGMSQVYHDLLRETYCCHEQNRCNDGKNNQDISRLPFSEEKEEEENKEKKG